MQDASIKLMQQYIVDASFVLAFLLPDEHGVEANEILQRYKKRELDLLSTHLLPFEVVNGLYISMGRQRISHDEATVLTDDYFKLRILLRDVDFKHSLGLANQYKLSVYDAIYLRLSQVMSLPLLTLDQKLQSLRKTG